MPPYWDNKALKHWCCFRKIVCKITDTSKVPFLHSFSVFKHWVYFACSFHKCVCLVMCCELIVYTCECVFVCVCMCVGGWVSLRARAPRGDPSWWSQLSSGASRQVSDRSLRWPDFIIAPAPVIESQQCVCVCVCVCVWKQEDKLFQHTGTSDIQNSVELNEEVGHMEEQRIIHNLSLSLSLWSWLLSHWQRRRHTHTHTHTHSVPLRPIDFLVLIEVITVCWRGSLFNCSPQSYQPNIGKPQRETGTHTHKHTRTHARTHTHTHTHTHTYIHTNTCTHARTHARTHVHTHARTHACTYIHTYIHTHTHTHTHRDPNEDMP